TWQSRQGMPYLPAWIVWSKGTSPTAPAGGAAADDSGAVRSGVCERASVATRPTVEPVNEFPTRDELPFAEHSIAKRPRRGSPIQMSAGAGPAETAYREAHRLPRSTEKGRSSRSVSG